MRAAAKSWAGLSSWLAMFAGGVIRFQPWVRVAVLGALPRWASARLSGSGTPSVRREM